jgi:hypothetical protein
VREQRVVLEHHPDAALVRRDVVDRLAVERDLAMGRGLETGQHHQAGRLARPRGSEHGQKLSLADLKVQVLHDQRLAVIAFLDAVEGDERVGLAGGQTSFPCRYAAVTHGFVPVKQSWRRDTNAIKPSLSVGYDPAHFLSAVDRPCWSD